MKNEDDASALLCVFRAQALRQQGFHDAADEAFKEALRSRSRAAPIRHLALAELAQNISRRARRVWLGRIWSGSWLRTRPTRAYARNWPSSSSCLQRPWQRGSSRSSRAGLQLRHLSLDLAERLHHFGVLLPSLLFHESRRNRNDKEGEEANAATSSSVASCTASHTDCPRSSRASTAAQSSTCSDRCKRTRRLCICRAFFRNECISLFSDPARKRTEPESGTAHAAVPAPLSAPERLSFSASGLDCRRHRSPSLRPRTQHRGRPSGRQRSGTCGRTSTGWRGSTALRPRTPSPTRVLR